MKSALKQIVAIDTLILMAFYVQAQGLSCASNIIQHSNNELANNNINTQKIRVMRSDQNTYIVLSKLSNGKSRFSCIGAYTGASHYIDFPSQYKVSDFETFGDTIYFCGQYSGASYNEGFIGYIAETDLLTQTSKFRFSAIDKMSTINKMKVYHNTNTNCNTIVGIGPLRTELKDCMLLFRANKTSISGTSMYQTQYNIYKCQLGNSQEVLHDIAITNNYICLVGNNPSAENQYCGTYQQMLLHRFNKTNPSLQTSNLLWLGDKPLVCSEKYHLETLNSDNVAIAYPGTISVSADKTFCSVVYKLDLTTINNAVQIKSASVFDANQDIINPILDIEYFQNASLLVLKNNADTNTFYTISMDNNQTFPYSAPTHYLSSAIYHFCNIIYISRLVPSQYSQYYDSYATLIGTNNNSLLVKAEKNMSTTGLSPETCVYSNSKQIETFAHNQFSLYTLINLTFDASYSSIVAEISLPTINVYQSVTTICTCNQE